MMTQGQRTMVWTPERAAAITAILAETPIADLTRDRQLELDNLLRAEPITDWEEMPPAAGFDHAVWIAQAIDRDEPHVTAAWIVRAYRNSVRMATHNPLGSLLSRFRAKQASKANDLRRAVATLRSLGYTVAEPAPASPASGDELEGGSGL